MYIVGWILGKFIVGCEVHWYYFWIYYMAKLWYRAAECVSYATTHLATEEKLTPLFCHDSAFKQM